MESKAKIQQMVPGVNQRKGHRMYVASDGFMLLAFEVCWSRGPDGIRYSDDLRNIREGITGVLSVLCLAGMYFSNDERINNCIIHYEHGVSDV